VRLMASWTAFWTASHSVWYSVRLKAFWTAFWTAGHLDLRSVW
jgi:hypothetical protein